MGDLITRKQRLRTLENEIRDGLLEGAEAFYYVGMKLREIRENELYTEDGFSSWRSYIDERLEIKRAYADELIRSSWYRHEIGPAGTNSRWTPLAFREITRIKKIGDAKRVAKKAESLAVKKDVPLSRAFVREIVDHELDRPPPQPKTKTPKENGDGNVHLYLDRYASEIEGMHEALQDVPEAGWMLLNRKKPLVIKRLIDECNRLAEFLKGRIQ